VLRGVAAGARVLAAKGWSAADHEHPTGPYARCPCPNLLPSRRLLWYKGRGMSDTLIRIKRAVLDGRYRFTDKAEIELEADGLSERDALESIMNAVAIYKTIRSRSPHRKQPGELLYIIQSTNLEGVVIYTKGTFRGHGQHETYYLLVSSKRST